MIVGTTNMNYTDIGRYVNSPDGLVTYATSLVPTWAQHIPGIIDNQRYLVAIYVRKMLAIDFYTRKKMVDVLVNGIRVKGVINKFISIYDILDACDSKALLQMLEKDYG